MFGCRAQYLPKRFEGKVDVLSTEQPQCEVQPRFHRRRWRLQRAPKSVDGSLGVSLVPDKNTKVVVRERIARIDLEHALVAVLSLGVPSFQLQRHSAPVPGLGGRRKLA